MSSYKGGGFDLIFILPALALESAAQQLGEASACAARIRELNRLRAALDEADRRHAERLALEDTRHAAELARMLTMVADQTLRERLLDEQRRIRELLLPLRASTALRDPVLDAIVRKADECATDPHRDPARRLRDLERSRAALEAAIPAISIRLERARTLQKQHLELAADVRALQRVLGEPLDSGLVWTPAPEAEVRKRIEILSIRRSDAIHRLRSDPASGAAYVAEQEAALERVHDKVEEAFRACGWDVMREPGIGTGAGACRFAKTLFRIAERTALEVTVGLNGGIAFEVVGLSGQSEAIGPTRAEYEAAATDFAARFPGIQAILQRSIGLEIQRTLPPDRAGDIRLVSTDDHADPVHIPAPKSRGRNGFAGADIR